MKTDNSLAGKIAKKREYDMRTNNRNMTANENIIKETYKEKQQRTESDVTETRHI